MQDICCTDAPEGSPTLSGLDREVVAKGFGLMMKDAFSLHRCASEGVVNLLGAQRELLLGLGLWL